MKKHLILPALAGFTLIAGSLPALADIGHASYYGRELAGRKTASGEIFRPEGMTAAHRSLPLGTKVKVTNLSNGKAVVLRINDRGPFVRGRMLDVSHGAAKVLGFAAAGTARVKIERLGRLDAATPVGAPLTPPAIAEPQPTLPEAELLRNPAGNGN
ncbi:MAG: septal ring lytic transglycosylase RlpA family protein [Rhabdaerophilum sp.]